MKKMIPRPRNNTTVIRNCFCTESSRMYSPFLSRSPLTRTRFPAANSTSIRGRAKYFMARSGMLVSVGCFRSRIAFLDTFSFTSRCFKRTHPCRDAIPIPALDGLALLSPLSWRRTRTHPWTKLDWRFPVVLRDTGGKPQHGLPGCEVIVHEHVDALRLLLVRELPNQPWTVLQVAIDPDNAKLHELRRLSLPMTLPPGVNSPLLPLKFSMLISFSVNLGSASQVKPSPFQLTKSLSTLPVLERPGPILPTRLNSREPARSDQTVRPHQQRSRHRARRCQDPSVDDGTCSGQW